MARKTKNQKKSKIDQAEIDHAAQAAASIMESAAEDTFEDTEETQSNPIGFGFGSLSAQEENYAEDDVFEEAFKKAVRLNTAPRYHIKKNSQFLAVKGYPYSWEQLQKEFGEGYYQVIAKSMANGQILKKQSEMVGSPGGAFANIEANDDDTQDSDHNMAYFAAMTQAQERADLKAKESARESQNNMATLMQTVMTLQQQSTQTMMTMMQESNKQFQNLLLAMNQPKGPDPLMTLVTTLLTKPKEDSGMRWETTMKLIKDAERDAENRTKNMYELVEKKADALAEMKAEAMTAGMESGEEEGGFKGLIKGFVPVLTQMIANQQASQGQPTPEQIHAIQEQRRLMGGNQGLDQGFIDDQGTRPQVGANRPAQRPTQQRPAQALPPQPEPTTQPTVSTAPIQSVPQDNGATVTNTRNSTQGVILDARKKREVFDFCAADIGQALMNREPASKTAQLVIEKLEKEGLPRHTVSASFTLEDFYGYANEYGLPEEVKPWLKEFNETIQKLADSKLVSQPAGRPQTNGVHAESNGATRSVAPERIAKPGVITRKQSKPVTKDL